MKQNHKTLLLWFILVCAFIVLYHVFSKDASRPDYAAFLADVENGRVSSVRLEPDSESADRVSLRVLLADGRSYETRPVALTAAMEAVETAHLPYSLRPAGRLDAAFFMSLVPVLLIGFFVLFFVRSLKTMGGSKSPGIKEMVEARIEVRPAPTVETTVPDSEPSRRFLSAVQDFKDGKDGPRKVLLVGPPGSGKTTLVHKAVAAAGLKWLPLPASDVANVFVGLAAARVRRAFELAGASAPCVLLLEDLDAMAARRSLPGEGKASEEGQLTEQVQGMIELCSILDGVREFPSGVLFVATSNRPDRLDEAIVRPGRIDLRLELPGP
jgi:ATP-dependent Zn protease